MRNSTPEPKQLNTIFGSGYVQEQHVETTDRTLPPTEHRAIGIATVWSVLFIMAIVKVVAPKFGNVVEVAMAWLSQP